MLPDTPRKVSLFLLLVEKRAFSKQTDGNRGVLFNLMQKILLFDAKKFVKIYFLFRNVQEDKAYI